MLSFKMKSEVFPFTDNYYFFVHFISHIFSSKVKFVENLQNIKRLRLL